ncbi:MAG: SMP-30/gluconolactonase/LRE family protein [Parvularculaceae bacterium]
MRRISSAAVFAIISAFALEACTPAEEKAAAPPATAAQVTADSVTPSWAFSAEQIFPADRSLMRPEDGVVLADGRIIVADQAHGLRAMSADGSSIPFGNFASAGYRHEPPAYSAGPNGVSFEPDRQHILVADIYTGAIWRTSVAEETTTLMYQHEFGANSAERDSTGALWFTQSTINRAGPDSEAGMFAAIDKPAPDGALYRIAAPGADGPEGEPRLMADSLHFANGLAIDERRGALYLAETMRNRVVAYPLDLAAGALGERRDFAQILTPDNLKLDEDGNLWVASPIRNEILVIDPDTDEARSVFRAATPDNDRIAAEWRRRGDAGEPMLSVMTPELWLPMPGLATSVILTPGRGPVYIGTLGDALVKLDR